MNTYKKTIGRHTFEAKPSPTQSLSFEATGHTYAQNGLTFKDEDSRVLGLIDRDNRFTNLAHLLSDQCPHGTHAAFFNGSSTTIFREREDFNGSLLAQFEDVFRWINGFNKTRSEFFELKRIDTRDYPVEAIRLALMNAFVRRDFSMTVPIFVRIFDDRIEMVSYTGSGLDMPADDVGAHVTVHQNPKLAKVFAHVFSTEIDEDWMDKLRACYQKTYRQPSVDVSTNAIRITLPNVNPW